MTENHRKAHWSEKYKERGEDKVEAISYIKENIDILNRGSVLDLACGDGRNAIFLGKSGFQVTGVDFSEEAISRLLHFSKEEGLSIDTKVLDVEDIEEVLKLGSFDNIILSFFKPSLTLFKALPSLLNKDGILLLCSYNVLQSQQGFPRKYCLEPDEFVAVSHKLSLVQHDVLEGEDQHLDGYIFRTKNIL